MACPVPSGTQPHEAVLPMKSWLLGLALTAVAVLVAVGVYWRSRPGGGPEADKPSFDLPPLSASPFQNTSLAVGYVGIAACKECHAEQHEHSGVLG